MHLPTVSLGPSAYIMKRMKRFINVSLATLVYAFPVLLVIAPVIKRRHPRPGLLPPEAQSLGLYTVPDLKFRSMTANARQRRDAAAAQLNEVDGPLFQDGERHTGTRVGAFIRKRAWTNYLSSSNVVCGEMSLVCPRQLPTE